MDNSLSYISRWLVVGADCIGVFSLLRYLTYKVCVTSDKCCTDENTGNHRGKMKENSPNYDHSKLENSQL